MVRSGDWEGLVCSFQLKEDCEQVCIERGLPLSVIPARIVLIHKVVIVGRVPGKTGFVKVMTVRDPKKFPVKDFLHLICQVTTKRVPEGDYVPIWPLQKRPYAIQLRLQHYVAYGLESYLRLDLPHEVPVAMLDSCLDAEGVTMRATRRGHGGMKELQQHINRRDASYRDASYRGASYRDASYRDATCSERSPEYLVEQLANCTLEE